MSEKIQNGWKWVKLGEVVKIKHGYAFPGKNITNQDTGKVLVTPGNFNIGGGFKSDKLKFYSGDYPKEYELQGGEIIVVMTDLSKDADILGYSAKIPTDKKYKYLHNQRIGLVEIISSHIDKDFIYWLMRTTDYHFFIVGGASGTSVMHTSPDRINEYSFPLPPLPEQKAIAEVLSSLDDKIELLHRQNKTLEEMAMTLFRQWFIEPTKDGLPEGWEEVRLGEFFPVITGKKDANFATDDGSYPFFTCSQKPLKAPNYSFDGNAILLAGNGDFNIKRYKGKFEAYQRTYVLIPYNSEYLNFLYLLMKFNLDEITGSFKGSVINYITKDMITDFKFSLPKDRSSIKDKLLYFDRIYDKVDVNTSQIQTLEKLRDTLLPKLMSGEVRVKMDIM